MPRRTRSVHNSSVRDIMESESPLEVLSRAATMLHREETAAQSPYANTTTSEYTCVFMYPYKTCGIIVVIYHRNESAVGGGGRAKGMHVCRTRTKYRTDRMLFGDMTRVFLRERARALAPGFPDRYRSGRFLRPAVNCVAYTARLDAVDVFFVLGPRRVFQNPNRAGH